MRKNPIIAERFKKVRIAQGKTFEDVYKDTGVMKSLLSGLESKESTRNVGYETIIILAKYYRVSIDYLLGLDDLQSVDKDIKTAVHCTGLNEAAIKNLKDYIDLERELYGDMPISETLSDMIATEEFLWMASDIRSACVSEPNEDPDILGVEIGDNGAVESATIQPRAYFKYAAKLKFQKLMDGLIKAYDEKKGRAK